uniref:YggT family protein n=1 Tax=Candidatus Kentrum sp. FM TaxID=2126340 RepID=A0A450W6L8_9GAMM|nr:MAG: YggT family protein [Candidatus Kentron sp. FM]VFJ67125.1 MAG: YggT family protein [Candidatus Kentron sp. FM]VFK12676.1 MAG: YggT family protein [Candidatus Kentron sp. FM]
MANPYVGGAGAFLVETLLGLYIMAVMLRFLLQVVHADFYNPFSQFLVKITNPPLRPLRRVIPGLWGVDLASVVLLLGLKSAEIWLISTMLGGGSSVGILIAALAKLLELAIFIFVFAIIIHVIMSWVNPHVYNPLVSLLYSLTEPLLGPARRWIPPISGLDLSPILVIVGLQLILMLFVAPIADLARGMGVLLR